MAALGRHGTINSLAPSILHDEGVFSLQRNKGAKPTIRLTKTLFYGIVVLILFLAAALNLRYLHLTINSSSNSKNAAATNVLKSRRANLKQFDAQQLKYAEQDGPIKAVQPRLSPHEAREFVKQRFANAGVDLDNATLHSLPTWNDILQNIGSAPRIYGLDQCEQYRAKVPALQRYIGGAGMFNSGTNLLKELLQGNCKIPERVEYYGWNNTEPTWGVDPNVAHGMLRQVPWGKHTPAWKRLNHTARNPEHNWTSDPFFENSKKFVLPVVMIRHPFTWMASMCRINYSARWPHKKSCPNLATRRNRTKLVHVRILNETYDSLAHLWNDWYRYYWKDADFPFLMVRHEDLIFHAENVTTQICHCAGGVIRTDQPFSHCVQSTKVNHTRFLRDNLTDMVGAWIKYGRELPVRGGFNKHDYLVARKFLDGELMQTFGYKHPRPV